MSGCRSDSAQVPDSEFASAPDSEFATASEFPAWAEPAEPESRLDSSVASSYVYCHDDCARV